MISFSTVPKLHASYRNLLLSDWTEGGLDSPLDLLDQALAAGEPPMSFDHWQESLPPEAGARAGSDLFPEPALRYLRRFLQAVGDEVLPGFSTPEGPTPSRSRRATPRRCRVRRALYHLTFPMFVGDDPAKPIEIRGDIGFWRDLQSLLFNLVVEFLLPVSRDYPEEHDALVAALFHLSATGWTRDPSHHAHLQSMLFQHLGEETRAIEAMEVSLSLTPPDSHDFLTTAQACWSLLVDSGRSRDAEKFLVELARKCSTRDLEEVTELTRTHYELIGRRGQKKPQRTR